MAGDDVIQLHPEQNETPTDPAEFRRMLFYSRSSWERQIAAHSDDDALHAYAEQLGYTLSTEAFFDNCESGLKPATELPALERALGMLEAGEAHAILVYRQDRLSCEPYQIVQILKRIWKANAEVYSYKDGRFENDALKLLEYQKQACFDAVARICARERRYEGLRRKGQNGGYTGGKRRYGYKIVNGNYVPDRHEQAVIAECIARNEAGESLGAIARSLITRGEPTALDGAWTAGQVQRLIRRGSYQPRAVPMAHSNGKIPIAAMNVAQKAVS